MNVKLPSWRHDWVALNYVHRTSRQQLLVATQRYHIADCHSCHNMVIQARRLVIHYNADYPFSPPDIAMRTGLYSTAVGFFFISFVFFRCLISEVTERISTKLGHIFTYDCYLKKFGLKSPWRLPLRAGIKRFWDRLWTLTENISVMDMYRGIMLSPMLSKLFEMVLLHLFQEFLVSDNLQFGFKKNSSCSHALFAFIESVKYFTSNGTKV